MKALFGLLLAFAVSLGASAAPNQDQAVTDGKAWLTLLDTQHYADSWTQASSLFRSNVDQKQWAAQIKPARDQFGDLVSRQLLKADLTKSLPGAPDGDYAVLSFQTDFAKKHQAVETVILALDGDHWRAAGYFIK